MRRSSAPSLRTGAPSSGSPSWANSVRPAPFLRPVAPASSPAQAYPGSTGVTAPGLGEDAEKILFNAVWCKSSSRKHKKWEDDAVLEVRSAQRMAVLREVSGGEICRGSGLSRSALESLVPGGTLSFAGRDVEVLERVGKALLDKEASNNRPQMVAAETEKMVRRRL